MAQYIDKSALVAEIKERIETYNKGYANGDDRRANALEVLLNDIDTLEVKDVDLDKEIDDIFQKYKNGYNGLLICKKSDFSVIAKHFFELGMQQSKNYNNNEE